MEKEIQLLHELIEYVGNKYYVGTPSWNLIEKFRQRSILRFLQKTLSNYYQ